MRHGDEDVRPFFGDTSDPVGPVSRREPSQPRRGTIDEQRQWRVDEGLCPRRSCGGELDSEQCCGKCGWSLLEEQARDRLRARERPEDRVDFLPRLPAALFIDEYAEANVDWDAA